MGLLRGTPTPAHADRHTGLGATQFVTPRKGGLDRRETQEGIAWSRMPLIGLVRHTRSAVGCDSLLRLLRTSQPVAPSEPAGQ